MLICTYRGQGTEEIVPKVEAAALILSAAVNLERLDLWFDTHRGQPLYPFGLLFGESTTWPCLTHLALAAVRVDPEALLEFFRRHQTTLKHVELSSVSIVGNRWEDFYHSMHECLDLDSFGTDEPTNFEMVVGSPRLR